LVSYWRSACWAAARRRFSASSGVSPGRGPSAGGAQAPGCSLISSVVNANTPSRRRSCRRACRACRAHAPHARSMHRRRSFFSRRWAAKSRSISSVIAASFLSVLFFEKPALLALVQDGQQLVVVAVVAVFFLYGRGGLGRAGGGAVRIEHRPGGRSRADGAGCGAAGRAGAVQGRAQGVAGAVLE